MSDERVDADKLFRDQSRPNENFSADRERLYRALFDLSPTGILLADSTGRILEVNDTLCKIFGYTREELLGNNLSILVPPEFHPDIEQHSARLLSDEILQHEVINIGKDGIRHFMELRETTIPLPGGQKGFLTVSTDITDRKRTEDQINMLAHTLRSVSECVSITDMEDKIIFVNDAFCRAYGYQANELIGRHVAMLRSPNTDPGISSTILPRTNQGGWHGILLNRRKNGEEFPVELSTSIIHDETGTSLALVGVAQDITERRKAEEHINMLAHALRSISDCVSVTDLDDRFIFVNDAFCKTYGYEPGELYGKHVALIVSPKNDCDVMLDVLRRTREGSWHGTILDIRKNGEEFPAELSTSIIRDEHGKAVALVGVAQDITERRKAEERLQQSNLELQTALTEVRTLSGMLPICSGCKKIRDDKGYWNQIEAYIAHHTDARFTHGLCPDCARKYFPGVEIQE